MIRTVITRKTIARIQSQLVAEELAAPGRITSHSVVPAQQDPRDGDSRSSPSTSPSDHCSSHVVAGVWLAGVRGGGTWSIPPGWNGWQRSSRQHRQPEPAHRSVCRDRGQRVLAARRVEPAPGRQGRDLSTDGTRRSGHDQRPCKQSRGATHTPGGLISHRWHLRSLARHRLRRPASSGLPARRRDRGGQVGAELVVRPGRGRRQRPHHQVVRRRKRSPADRGPGGAGGDGPGCASPRCRRPWDTTKPGPGSGSGAVVDAGRHGSTRCTTRLPRPARRPARMAAANSSAASQTLLRREHRRPRGRQAERRARPLDAARREDRATGPGAHAQPEAVGLRAPTVVRLVRALAHCDDAFRAHDRVSLMRHRPAAQGTHHWPPHAGRRGNPASVPAAPASGHKPGSPGGNGAPRSRGAPPPPATAWPDGG